MNKMPEPSARERELLNEIAGLKSRLEEAEETLHAIRQGEVDALVINTDKGAQIYTLQGQDARMNRFRGQILGQITDAVIVVDDREHVTYLNAAAEKLYGVTSPNVLGTPLSRIYLNRCRQGEEEARMAALRATGKWAGEVVQVRHDGDLINVEMSLTRLQANSDIHDGWIIVSRDVTERNQALSDLHRSEEMLKLGMRVAGLALAEIDYSTGLNHLTADCAKLFGLGENEIALPREQIHGTFHPDDFNQLMGNIAQVLQPESPGYFNKDHRVVWPDGQVRWLRVRKQVFFREEGYERKPARAILAAMDVTSEKHAAFMVKQNEIFIKQVLDSLPVLVVVLDQEGVIIMANEPWNRFARENGGEVCSVSVGINYIEVCRRAAIEGDLEAKEALEGLESVRSGRLPQAKITYGCADEEGAQRWFVMHVRRLINGDNSGMIVSHIEITEAKRAELALQESEEKYRMLLASLQDGVFVAQDYRFVFANPALPELLGYSETEFIGLPFEKIIDPEHLALWTERFQKRISLGPEPAWRYEVRLNCKNGERLWVELSARRITYNHQPAVLGIFRNITESKAAEQALRDADQRKNEFLAMLGHELRNPLTPISTVSYLMCEQALDEESYNWARDVLRRNVVIISRLVNDLLDISRITRGLVALQCEQVELGLLLDDSLEAAAKLISGKKQSLDYNKPDYPVYLHGDPVRLTQVFTNLIHNAAKYTGEGGRLAVSLSATADVATVLVKDNGQGLAPELQPFIFDLFVQGKRGLDRSEGGLGIGLTLVKKIVELHEGKITAHSNGVNQGSEFVVQLPMRIENKPMRNEGLSNASLLNSKSGLKVLLIDDNEDVAESLATWLKMSGHEVQVASSGTGGIQAALDFAPHIVLLDIGLPDLDGYQVAHQLKKLPNRQDMTVIGLSGNTPIHDEIGGFDHYLIKPPKISQLQELIAARGKK